MTYRISRSVATALGISFAAIDVYAVASSLYVRETGISYIVVAGACVAATAPILPLLAEHCWRVGQRLKAVAVSALLAPVLILVILSATERMSTARDRETLARLDQAQRVDIARAAVTDADAEISSLAASARAECRGGRGRECRRLESELAAARSRLAAARVALADIGVAQEEDPLAQRIAAIVPGITQEQVNLYLPLLLPVMVPLLGIVLLAIGLAPDKAGEEQPTPPRKKKKRPAAQKGPPKSKTVRKPKRGPVQIIPFPRKGDLEKP